MFDPVHKDVTPFGKDKVGICVDIPKRDLGDNLRQQDRAKDDIEQSFFRECYQSMHENEAGRVSDPAILLSIFRNISLGVR